MIFLLSWPWCFWRVQAHCFINRPSVCIFSGLGSGLVTTTETICPCQHITSRGQEEHDICLSDNTDFDLFVKWCLPDFSTINCCFPLKLISTFRESLWEYVNILFLIKVLPIDFSVHWLFLPESFITMMVAKWWFPVTLHLLVIFYYKEEFSLFTNLFILVCTHGFFFYSVNYSPLLSLF